MLITNKNIAVIGGGPGGLTLARLLQQKGAIIKVYERDATDEARVQGATLDLHFESGLKAIRAAGLLDEFRSAYRPGSGKGRVVDKHGNIVCDEHTTIATESFDDEHFRPEIDRGPLRDLLLASLEPGTVVWNSQFLTMEPCRDGWTLTFKNGTTAYADIVIGADGANSRVRPFLTTVKPFYAGTIIMQGNVPHAADTIPEMHELLQGGKIYGYADEKFLHVSSKGDGSIDFYMSSKQKENWLQHNEVDFSDRSQLTAWFSTAFPDWGPVWHSLIKETALPLLLRPQHCIPAEGNWKTLPNLTLLGDAAHIMPPSGEGVNLAMLDALELTECLTGNSFNTIQDAVSAYEEKMHVRSAVAAADAMEMGELMHSVDAMEKFIQLYLMQQQ